MSNPLTLTSVSATPPYFTKSKTQEVSNMATLRKRGKSYSILVKQTIGYKVVDDKKKQLQKVIASFNLGKVTKETAIFPL